MYLKYNIRNTNLNDQNLCLNDQHHQNFAKKPVVHNLFFFIKQSNIHTNQHSAVVSNLVIPEVT